ncbi:hypothetical protein [Zhihengliuella halotolerans]|uniref:hypothetical protein n=1 Tax=Zhihengliuella halotolerans TaxID=370736 RepID=UPI00102B34AD|nr:hypothetical protein [Zhihengliuella halotolerans]
MGTGLSVDCVTSVLSRLSKHLAQTFCYPQKYQPRDQRRVVRGFEARKLRLELAVVVARLLASSAPGSDHEENPEKQHDGHGDRAKNNERPPVPETSCPAIKKDDERKEEERQVHHCENEQAGGEFAFITA